MFSQDQMNNERKDSFTDGALVGGLVGTIFGILVGGLVTLTIAKTRLTPGKAILTKNGEGPTSTYSLQVNSREGSVYSTSCFGAEDKSELHFDFNSGRYLPHER